MNLKVARHADEGMYTVRMSTDVLHKTYILVYSRTNSVMYVTTATKITDKSNDRNEACCKNPNPNPSLVWTADEGTERKRKIRSRDPNINIVVQRTVINELCAYSLQGDMQR